MPLQSESDGHNVHPDGQSDGVVSPGQALAARCAAVSKLLRLSESMLSSARDGHWAQVQANEPERHRQVWTFFEQPLNAIEADRFAAELKRILEISQELTRLANDERSNLASAAKDLAHGQQAAQAYAAQSYPWTR